jgi:hypothetical protein
MELVISVTEQNRRLERLRILFLYSLKIDTPNCEWYSLPFPVDVWQHISSLRVAVVSG